MEIMTRSTKLLCKSLSQLWHRGSPPLLADLVVRNALRSRLQEPLHGDSIGDVPLDASMVVPTHGRVLILAKGHLADEQLPIFPGVDEQHRRRGSPLVDGLNCLFSRLRHSLDARICLLFRKPQVRCHLVEHGHARLVIQQARTANHLAAAHADAFGCIIAEELLEALADMSDWEAFGFGVANDVAVHVLHAPVRYRCYRTQNAVVQWPPSQKSATSQVAKTADRYY
mmetsp:Transcript_93049/g.221245  ORF Transcript_93049/g.221245 Transcript_93049/m.221245 type:complete len:227 (+) Transcript_93049:1252-1932(+)